MVKNILLINPEWIVKDKSNLWSKIASKYPALGLASIAAVLEKEGHKVTFIDMLAEEMSLEQFKLYFKFNGLKFDYVGITATTPLINNALQIAKEVKELFPNKKVILGGVHPSMLDEEVIKNKYVDIVVRGEGEITMKEIVADKNLEKIDGITYKNNGLICRNFDRKFIENLDDLPMPAYYLMPIHKYKPALGAYKRLPAMSIFATRGCPGLCTFCCRLFKGKIRVKSARKIVDEIKYLIKDFGIKEISFYDDTFTAMKDNVREFCNIIINEKVDITWSCFTRVNYIDEELFTLMKKAGCHLVLFGVESGNQNILNKMNKMISIEQIKKAVSICRKIGIHTRASYIFGCIDDTEETMKETLKFALELDTDYAQFNIMTAYPGTKLWQEAKENGWLIIKDYDYSVSDFTMQLPTVSNERIKYYYNLAHKKFYLRPKILWRQILEIKNFTILLEKIKGGIAVIF